MAEQDQQQEQRAPLPIRRGCPYGHQHCGGNGYCGYERLSEEEMALMHEEWGRDGDGDVRGCPEVVGG